MIIRLFGNFGIWFRIFFMKECICLGNMFCMLKVIDIFFLFLIVWNNDFKFLFGRGIFFLFLVFKIGYFIIILFLLIYLIFLFKVYLYMFWCKYIIRIIIYIKYCVWLLNNNFISIYKGCIILFRSIEFWYNVIFIVLIGIVCYCVVLVYFNR